MKNLKKNIALLSAMALAGTMLAGCDSDKPAEDTTAAGSDAATTDAATTDAPATTDDLAGGTLKICAWNEEFKERLELIYGSSSEIDGVKIDWVITPNEGNAYQNKLDEDLEKQASATGDDLIDMFLIEADYALKYINTDYTLDIYSLPGITSADTADMYGYTKDVVTNDAGVLKGVSWQGCPGALIYRRSIATELFGDAEQATVQAKVATWDAFNATAADMKAAGYFMLSGYDDSYRVFSNNVTAPWVNADKKIVIDDNLMKWVDQTKDFTDNGYNNKTLLWSGDWGADMNETGKVFAYFGPGWFIDFTMTGNGAVYGDWGVTEGPQGFNWGGTWLTAAKGTDNAALVAKIMKDCTMNKDNLVKVTREKADFTNNKGAMDEIAADASYQNEFLGMNHIAVLAKSADSISMKGTMSAYDQGLNESFQLAMHDYFNGAVDKDTALQNFYNDATEKYPALSY